MCNISVLLLLSLFDADCDCCAVYMGHCDYIGNENVWREEGASGRSFLCLGVLHGDDMVDLKCHEMVDIMYDV